MLTLSLIIPVYNEERHIGACLDAVAAQTRMPDEVIVVDNNCTDRTIEIAEQYDFVTVVRESRQGHAPARSAGFNAASGDILGRIDADSRIEKEWAQTVLSTFESSSDIVGVGGVGKTVFIPGINFVRSTLFPRAYYWFAHAGYRTITMWGANMAVRRSAWEKVASKTILDDPLVHEDQDLSLWLAASGGVIVQNNALMMRTNGQTYRFLPKTLLYYRMFLHTRQLHARNGNLSSPRLHRLGFWQTLPGYIAALGPGFYLFIMSLLFFPVDYIVNKLWPNSWWLD